ncbi:winged helix-turn-helix transcriptional regulator [Candidatus Bipolaricaulota bacterium]|nr:winged helix-turn-helix transcriptional regulator [Candidatus Bipolaricaulota bacterium]MBS3825955.1 winged helix-turn-helix transcriptional regulator [Candidatus Bipolaricaulota bacterium]
MKFEKLAEVLKTVAHEKRLRILVLLEEFDGNICVCELVDALNTPQYQVSQHLRELRGKDLVRGNRDGTWVYYSINPDLPRDLRQLIDGLLEHLDREDYSREIEKLEKRLEMREDGKCVVGYDESDE